MIPPRRLKWRGLPSLRIGERNSGAGVQEKELRPREKASPGGGARGRERSGRDASRIQRAVRTACAAAAVVLLPVPQAPGGADWSKFDPPALTVISPEEKALSNPPFLHWQMFPEVSEYEVRLSGPGGEHRWTTRRNFLTPPEKLVPGRYALKVTARGKDNSVLGTSSRRDFQIPDRAPGLAADWESLTTAPVIRFALSPAELEEIRNADGERGRYRDGLLAEARKPRPDVLTPFEEPARYTDGRWNHAQWSRNNRICEAAHGHVLRQTAAFLITGEQPFLDEVTTTLLALARWNPTGSTGVWENDHSAWHLLHSLSFAYHVLGEHLSPAARRAVAEAIRLRCADMDRFLNPFVGKDTSAGRMNDPDNNHPWFCTAALGFGGLALWNETPEARGWASFAAQMFHGMFLPRGDSDGGWHEGIDYWSYTLYFVVQWADALKAAGGPDLYRHPWLANTVSFKVYAHPPAGGYVPFGDCRHQKPSAFDKLVMMRFASVYSDPLAWRYVDAIPGEPETARLFQALLWSAGRPKEMAPMPSLPPVKLFRNMGWLISNSAPFDPEQQVLFAFRCGPFFGRAFGHTQGDLNSFVLTAGGDKLLWDAGYYDSYLSLHHRDYARHSAAHNTILVDGAGQLVHTAGLDGRIVRFETDGTSFTVTGDVSAPLIYDGRVDRFMRTIEFSGQSHLTVSDEIVLHAPGQVSWLLHSTFPFDSDSTKNRFRLAGNRYCVEGTLESRVPVTVRLTDGFPVAPAETFKAPTGPDGQPERQFHLEWKTVEKVKNWAPRVRIRIIPNTATGNGAAHFANDSGPAEVSDRP